MCLLIHSICRERMLRNGSGINLRCNGDDARITCETRVKRIGEAERRRGISVNILCFIAIKTRESVFEVCVNERRIIANIIQHCIWNNNLFLIKYIEMCKNAQIYLLSYILSFILLYFLIVTDLIRRTLGKFYFLQYYYCTDFIKIMFFICKIHSSVSRVILSLQRLKHNNPTVRNLFCRHNSITRAVKRTV